MKKLISFLLLAALLSGCTSSQVPAGTTVPPATVEESSFPEELTIDSVCPGGTWNEDPENLLSWDYCLPQLSLSSPGAQQFNHEILSLIPELGQPPVYKSITWESHEWNGITSLVLKLTDIHAGELSCMTFHYDETRDLALTDLQLAETMGYPESALTTLLYENTAACFDRVHSKIAGESLQDRRDLKAQTLSPLNLDPARVSLFLDDTGCLSAIVPLAVYEGSGIHAQALQLKPSAGPAFTASDGYVTAELTKGALTLVYSKKENSPWSMSPDYIPHDTPIPVDRLTGNYVDMTIGYMNSEFLPLLLLVDENGELSFCDLGTYDSSAAAIHGIGPISCGAPLIGFSQMEAPWGTIPCGITKTGEKVDLCPWIGEASILLSYYLGATVWETEAPGFSMTFPSENQIQWKKGEEVIASGYVWYAGLDQNGQHYHYALYQGADTVSGAVSLRFAAPDTGDFPWLELTNTSSVSFPGLPIGESQRLFWQAP